MAVSELVAVQVIKDAQRASEQIHCFRRRERPVHLRKILLRIFRQDVGKGDPAKLIAPHFEQADKMRVREERGGLPSCELGLSCYVIDKNKLYRRSLWFTLGPFCKESGAALAAPEISEEPKGPATIWPCHSSQARTDFTPTLIPYPFFFGRSERADN